MNRAKPTTVRRPSAAAKPSGHPPPGDFIALGSKGQANESKTASTLLKPAPSGLPSERKRDAAAALSGASALTGLTKRPKLSSTPPLSALGRLAEAAVAEKRAISPSIKEPSVVPIEGNESLDFAPHHVCPSGVHGRPPPGPAPPIWLGSPGRVDVCDLFLEVLSHSCLYPKCVLCPGLLVAAL
ncbi:Integrator complex subunit 1 [Saguinus oedipus]|uniref:Integrator complex subunit 1 n=1 Tax=Saguinus oedipus TaxID=9490 RepID=A0ABQ9W5C4_SAGOE|nr:Integrator complex subunit 1 [Saguinus oedipus]